MKALTPWTRLPTLRQELDRLFTRFDDDSPVASAFADWAPTVDVTEVNGTYVVKTECPGVEAKDLHVRMENDVLTIEGEKKADVDEKSDKTWRRERMFGSFAREIRFPTSTDGTAVKARLVNGVLTLTIPKATSAKASSIPIQAG